MQEHDNPPAPPQPHATRATNTTLATTAENKARFLQAMESHLNVTTAAKRTGIHRATVYRWMEEDATFAAQVKAARDVALDALEDNLYDRAIGGDNVATIVILKAHRQAYRESQMGHGQQIQQVVIKYDAPAPMLPTMATTTPIDAALAPSMSPQPTALLPMVAIDGDSRELP